MALQNAGRDSAIAEQYGDKRLLASNLIKDGIANKSARSLEAIPLVASKIVTFKSKLSSMQKKAKIGCLKVNSDIESICHEAYDHKHRFIAEEYCKPWTFQIPYEFTLSELMEELMCRKDARGKTERYYRDSSKLAKKIREIITQIRLTADRIVKSNKNGTYPFQLSQSALCAANLSAKFGEDVLEGQKIIDDDPRSVVRVSNLIKPFVRELMPCGHCP
jgi:hypothetical protein